MTDCSRWTCEFSSTKRKKIIADFAGGKLTSPILPAESSPPMPGACWAETAEEASVLLEQAEQYVREANYPDAEAIYKSVVADYPGTDDAFTAQGRLAMLYLRWGNQATQPAG